MNTTAVQGETVARKKSEPKRYGTLIRVTDAFAEAIRDGSSFEKMSVAEYANTYLLPIVEKRYRDAVVKAARKMEGR